MTSNRCEERSQVVVWRRIPPWHFSESPDRSRPDSAAFDDDKGGSMSVVIARRGRRPEELIVNYPDFGVVALTAQVLAEAAQELRAVWVARP